MRMNDTFYLLFSLFLLIHTANAFDITQILNKFPDFSNFNSYLTQTNLATTINGRQSITILVVDNGNLSPLSSKSPEVIKNILSVHILLEYYDVIKLQQLTGSSPLLPTLFQSTGLARGQQGFLNVSHPSPQSTAFGSAMPGSTTGSSLIKSVAAEPYNVSVLQISNLIIPQGIDDPKTSAPLATSPPPPPPAPATVTPPPPSPATATPPPKASMAPPPASTSAPPPSMTKAPASAPPPPTKANIAPTNAKTPSAAPGAAPAPGASSSPDAAPAEEEETPTSTEPATTPKSAATTLEMGLGLVCTMALSTLYLGGSRI